MNVALIGATGEAGSNILNELLARGHRVTAIARDLSRLAPRPGVTAVQEDAGKVEETAAALQGHDAVISSIRFVQCDPDTLIAAVKAAGVPRYLVVGGAGSLFVPGTQVMIKDEIPYPDFVMLEADRGYDFLQRMRQEKELDWTFLSPAKYFKNTGRTGIFRLGGDEALLNAEGDSKISFQDYSIALVDELERPRHTRVRFSVAY